MKTINALSFIAALSVTSSWVQAQQHANSMRFSDYEMMLSMAKRSSGGQSSTTHVSTMPSAIITRLKTITQNKRWQLPTLFSDSPKSQVVMQVVTPKQPKSASRFGVGRFNTLDAAKVKILQNQLAVTQQLPLDVPPSAQQTLSAQLKGNASETQKIASASLPSLGVTSALKPSMTIAKLPVVNTHMGTVPYDREPEQNETFQNQNPYQVIEQVKAGHLNNLVQNMYGDSETPTLSVMSRKLKSKTKKTAYRRVVQAPPASYAPMPVNPAANRMQPAPAIASQGFAPQNDGVRQWIIYPNDGTIFASLSRWAKDAGWQVSWEAPMDFPVTLSAGFQGTFGEAVEGVMRSLSQSDFPLQACLYEGNRVVRVMRLVTNSRSCE